MEYSHVFLSFLVSFCLLPIFSQCSITQVFILPETSQFYSHVEIGLEHSFGEPLPLIHIDSWNTEVFQIERPAMKLGPICSAQERNPPEMIYHGDPLPMEFCPFVLHSFGSFYSFGVLTHFYNKTVVNASGSVNGELFRRKSNLINLVPREMSSKFQPLSIEEGQKYYSLFQSVHLERKLAFRQSPGNQVMIGSYQRSGTHVLFRSLEEITQEFIRTFPFEENVQARDQHVASGEVKGQSEEVTPGFVVHQIGARVIYKISRVILIVRSPLVSADSNFHLDATNHNHVCKVGGDYLNEDSYHNYIKRRTFGALRTIRKLNKKARKETAPSLWLRYEDLVANPMDILTQALTFYLGVPAEIAFKEEIETYLKTKGLSSFYRKEQSPTHLRKKKASNQPLIESLDKFPESLVRYNLENIPNFLDAFGYSEVYQERLEMEVTPSTRKQGLLLFELHNKESAELMLAYKFDNSKMKNKLVITDEPTSKDLDPVSFQDFEKFPRVCPENR